MTVTRAGPALARPTLAGAALLATLLATPLAAQDNAADPAALPPEARQAVIGVLDKRLGRTENFTLKPGESFRFGRISATLRACETTRPYEPKQSAAFVEVEEQQQTPGNRQQATKRIFSGWLFAEAASRNPLEHPVYDVWLKSCTMYVPEGPAPASRSTGTASGAAANPGAARSGGDANPVAASDPSSAARSPG